MSADAEAKIIEPGDYVRAKAGGPLSKVESVDGELLEVRYMQGGEVATRTYLRDEIEKARYLI